MGADFILAIVRVPDNKEAEQYREGVAKLSNLDWTILRDDHCCPLLPEAEDYDISDAELRRSDCERIALDVLDMMISWSDLKNLDRDMTVRWLDGNKYIASGGLTWGDPPTDAYETLDAYETIRDYIKGGATGIPHDWMIVNDRGEYWSNDDGWGDEASATRFTEWEQSHLHLPILGRWVQKEEN